MHHKLFAKVLRRSRDGVLLMELMPLGANFYRVDTSSVWLHENTSEMAFCDGVWLHDKQCYEIRSNKKVRRARKTEKKKNSSDPAEMKRKASGGGNDEMAQLRAQLQEAQRREQEAQRLREEAQRRVQEAQRREQQAQQQLAAQKASPEKAPPRKRDALPFLFSSPTPHIFLRACRA